MRAADAVADFGARAEVADSRPLRPPLPHLPDVGRGIIRAVRSYGALAPRRERDHRQADTTVILRTNQRSRSGLM